MKMESGIIYTYVCGTGGIKRQNCDKNRLQMFSCNLNMMLPESPGRPPVISLVFFPELKRCHDHLLWFVC